MSDQTLITADDRIFVAGHRGMAVDLRRKQLWVPVGAAGQLGHLWAVAAGQVPLMT